MFIEGEVVIYNWIEWIRSNAYTFLNLDSYELEKSEAAKKQAEAKQYQAELEAQQAKEEEDIDKGGAIRVTEYKKIKIISGASFTVSKSKFVAHVAHITSDEDAREVIRELYKTKKIAEATHNMVAYRFEKLPEKTTVCVFLSIKITNMCYYRLQRIEMMMVKLVLQISYYFFYSVPML